MSDRVIRDGRVAVLVSPGYGAGWSTWNSAPGLVFCPAVVEWVEAGKVGDIDEVLASVYGPDRYVCTLGAEQLEIVWMPVGNAFKVTEYDGAESILNSCDDVWETA